MADQLFSITLLLTFCMVLLVLLLHRRLLSVAISILSKMIEVDKVPDLFSSNTR